jgi:Uncharacterized protein conserved in bacteria (DUF2066)
MTETQQNTPLSALFAFVAVSMLFLFCNAGEAKANDLYLIRGISVDKSATSATEARRIAVAEGQRRAFGALVRKLTLKGNHNQIPMPSDSELTSMVTGFQVANEKTAAKRYIADLSFEFRRQLVFPLLEANNIPYSESVSKPIVVLPVFENKGIKNLWNEPNPWRDAWLEVFESQQAPEGSEKRLDDWAQTKLLPIEVPTGTLEDLKAISVEDAIYLNKEAVDTIKEMYGASAVLVAYASLQNQNGVLRLDISYQRSDFLSAAVIESFTGGDTERDIFRAAIFDVVENLQEGWKDQNILDRSLQNRLAVTSQINGLRDWLTIREKTNSIPAVEQITVREVSTENVFWEVSFLGDLVQLRSALAQRDLTLENEEGYWTIDPIQPQ